MARLKWLAAVVALGTVVLSPVGPLMAARKLPCCCHGVCPLAAKPPCHTQATAAFPLQICPGCSGTEMAAVYFLYLGILPAAVRLDGLGLGPPMAGKSPALAALLPARPRTPPPKAAPSSSHLC